VVSCASGTDALKISLLAAGVGPGDAVFVPSFTFVATAEAVASVGASPVFVDVDETTFNIDPGHLEMLASQVASAGRLRPRAVIPVDMFGLPADYGAIEKTAGVHEMLVIADATQSFGASAGGTRVGTLAPVSATSFYPSKPLGCFGDGGCLFIRDREQATVMRQVARHGFGADGHSAIHVGLNSRLDTLQAIVLLAKLRIFDDELAARRRVVSWYEERLADVVTTPRCPADCTSAWAIYTVLTENRDQVLAALTDRQIGSAVYYRVPIHLQPAYADFGDGPGSLPVTEALCRKTLALPVHPYLTEKMVGCVTQVVRGAVQERSWPG
jgi:dTDP-4-amino-4,6-dideoxygalactose transaminase